MSEQSPSSPGQVAILVLRVLLGLFFIYSGGVKIFAVGLSDFVDSVGNYQIVGGPWDAVVGYILPWVEIMAGLALVVGMAAKGGALVIVGLLLFFNLALGMAWASGIEINCGCHSKSDEPTNYLLKILSNFGLLAIALASLWGSMKASKSPNEDTVPA